MTDGLIGVLCNSYKIESLIGDGAYFEVFKSEHIELPGRFAATRMLRGKFRKNSYFQKQLRIEVENLDKFEHERIVGVIDFGQIDDSASEYHECFFVHLNYMPNGSLRDFIENAKQSNQLITEDKVLQVAEETLDGLIYIHSNGSLHKDIHADNLLFDENGQIGIADFGLAQWVIKTGLPSKTGTSAVGFYTPPEALDMDPLKNGLRPSSDIFQLGNTLAYMCSGLETSVSQDSVGPRIRRNNPNISDDLIEILTKSVQDIASDRYQSAEEMLDAIKGLKKSRSLDSYVRANYFAEYQNLLAQNGVLPPKEIDRVYALLDQAEKKAGDIPVVREMHKMLDKKSVSDYESIDSTLTELEDNKNKNASKKVEELGKTVSAYRNIGGRCELYRRATRQLDGWR